MMKRFVTCLVLMTLAAGSSGCLAAAAAGAGGAAGYYYGTEIENRGTDSEEERN